ncbi:MAG: hypothetical protein ABWZ26_01375 [Candidatus Nanopelagicales bacterium]
MGFTRKVRVVSERQLMTAAERRIATRYGTLPPSKPKGVDLFWQKVYVPLYHRIPWSVRARVMRLMPGSHRETWHTPPRAGGPAV